MQFDPKKVEGASQKLALALAREIGDHKVIGDPDLLESYAGDESVCDAHLPHFVVRAADADDVTKTLMHAEVHGAPVTPRGGGTGKAGGAIPIFGGIVLDMSRLKSIKEIDKDNLLAVVGPGVVTGDFHQTVEKEGLFYPPDPNSWENCHLGGNVAHNAGGPRAFKYGVTREYVFGLSAVAMGGHQLDMGRRTVKGVAGYDLTGLMVGSEGTLAVFTELVLRLRANPPQIATLLVRFNDELAAGRAVASIIRGGLVPRVLEFMDSVLVDTLREAGASGVPKGTEALLLAELDGEDEALVEEEALRFADYCEKEGAEDVIMARHIGERNQLWAARRSLSDAVKKRARKKVSEDIVVPRDKADAFLAGMRRIGQKHKVLTAAYGHAGDGNYHANVLWDDPDFNPMPAVDEIMRLVLDLGGTITGEHGIGLAKKRWLPWEKSQEQLKMMKGIKSQFDPKGLLNPGKIFD